MLDQRSALESRQMHVGSRRRSLEGMDHARVQPGLLEGSIQLRRIGGFGFPVEQLVADGEVVAELGRDSSFWIFFGRGRRVRLADGTHWRIKSTTSGRHIVPLIRSDAGLVAISGPLYAKRSYGINVKDHGYTLIPLGHTGIRRAGLWSLRRHETQVAAIEDHDRIMHATEPIPIAAALMAFTLMKHGIPGEANLMPKRD